MKVTKLKPSDIIHVSVRRSPNKNEINFGHGCEIRQVVEKLASDVYDFSGAVPTRKIDSII